MGNSDPLYGSMEFNNETKIFPNRAQDLSAEFLFYHTTNDLRVNGVNNVFYEEIDPTFSGGGLEK